MNRKKCKWCCAKKKVDIEKAHISIQIGKKYETFESWNRLKSWLDNAQNILVYFKNLIDIFKINIYFINILTINVNSINKIIIIIINFKKKIVFFP